MKKIGQFLDDLLVAGGCGMILVGVWQVCPVAVWFVGGAMMIAFGVIIGMARGRA